MSTFAGWLHEQIRRPDEVGELARLWMSYEHPKYSGVASVIKSLSEQAAYQKLAWVAGAQAAAVAEYRQEKAPSPALQFEQTARLNRIDEKLDLIMAHLGISALAAVPDGNAQVVVLRTATEWQQPHEDMSPVQLAAYGRGFPEGPSGDGMADLAAIQAAASVPDEDQELRDRMRSISASAQLVPGKIETIGAQAAAPVPTPYQQAAAEHPERVAGDFGPKHPDDWQAMYEAADFTAEETG